MTQEHNPIGYIYISLVQVGSMEVTMPDTFFPELMSHTMASLPSAVKAAHVVLFVMGGAQSKNDSDNKSTCINAPSRKARYFCIIGAYWKPEHPNGKAETREWVKNCTNILHKYKTEGPQYSYAPDEINQGETVIGSGVDIFPHEVDFAKEIYPKLIGLKKKYDPKNLFHRNKNIPISY
jgi:hypothetical protein